MLCLVSGYCRIIILGVVVQREKFFAASNSNQGERQMRKLDEKRIKELKAQGLTNKVISDRLQVSEQTICKILARKSTKTTCLKWTPEIVVSWRQLKREGWKLKQIAEKYGTSTSMVGAKLAAQL